MKAKKRAAKSERRGQLQLEPLAVASVRTPAGTITVVCSAAGLREVHLGAAETRRREARARGIRFVRRPRWTAGAKAALQRFVAGRAVPATLPLDLACGTPFQRRVWEATRAVPWGEVVSYAEIARRAGAPRAVRAVGNALGDNPVPIVVPCHRVVHSGGSIGGFTSGLDWKRYLLSLEGGQLELEWRKPRQGVLGLLRAARRAAGRAGGR
jgi:methylated-DNA-[protein]-cysteine S-methyltransferase